MSSLTGQQLGNYEIVSLLGKGGMATVYRARQLNIKREVALKVIKSDLAESGDFTRRFEREAETIAALDHPHIIKLFDYGQQGDTIYLVMQLLKGGSLAELIRKGPLPLDTVNLILDQISSALEYAHVRDIIHRDLKPQNVLLDEAGNAFLTDFGIARLVTQSTALTQSGVAIGTPAYMAPEQWQSRFYDARADLYALGVVLYEMLTGRLPFDAETPARMMYQHLQEPPPSTRVWRPDLPPGIEPVMDKALAKRPEDRFQSAVELAQAFRVALLGQMPTFTPLTSMPAPSQLATPTAPGRPTPAPEPMEATQPSTRQGRSTLLGIGVIALVLVLLGGSLGMMLGSRAAATATLTPSNTVIPLPTLPKSGASEALPATPTSLPQPTVKVAALPTLTNTPPPTLKPSETPNQEQTINAIVQKTLTAAAVVPTATPSDTSTPVPPTVTPSPSRTVTSTPEPTDTNTPVLTLTLISSALTSIPCTVSTEQDNVVPIRVGPGKNRGLRDYMPANRSFAVIGQALASDGSIWWKLKTDDASEAWVAQADVDASGACDRVSGVPTPPIQTAKPPAPTATVPPTAGGGSVTSNGGGSGGSAGGGNPGGGSNGGGSGNPTPQPTSPQPTSPPPPPTLVPPDPTDPPCLPKLICP